MFQNEHAKSRADRAASHSWSRLQCTLSTCGVGPAAVVNALGRIATLTMDGVKETCAVVKRAAFRRAGHSRRKAATSASSIQPLLSRFEPLPGVRPSCFGSLVAGKMRMRFCWLACPKARNVALAAVGMIALNV